MIPNNVLCWLLYGFCGISFMIVLFGVLIHLPWMGIPYILGILGLSAYFW